MTFEDLTSLIGMNCRVIRERKGLSQQIIAERMGKSRTAAVSEFESGKSNPTLLTISQFAEALEVDVLDLLNFEALRHEEIHQDHLKLEKLFRTLRNRNSNEIDYITNITETFFSFVDQEQKILTLSKNPPQT